MQQPQFALHEVDLSSRPTCVSTRLYQYQYVYTCVKKDRNSCNQLYSVRLFIGMMSYRAGIRRLTFVRWLIPLSFQWRIHVLKASIKYYFSPLIRMLYTSSLYVVHAWLHAYTDKAIQLKFKFKFIYTTFTEITRPSALALMWFLYSFNAICV
jgi:hypothetical protein